MVPHYPVVSTEQLLLKSAGLPPQISTALFAGSILAVLVLAFTLLYRRFPAFFVRMAQQAQNFLFPGGARHEARLERIICQQCNKGMGVYDPIYVTYKGESYIEGICSCCGHFVRARLR